MSGLVPAAAFADKMISTSIVLFCGRWAQWHTMCLHAGHSWPPLSAALKKKGANNDLGTITRRRAPGAISPVTCTTQVMHVSGILRDVQLYCGVC
jgi:hypothetical protein